MSGARNNAGGKALAIAGVICLFGPIVGMLGAVVMMTLAFHSLGANGIADPHMLAANVGSILWVTVAGLVLLVIGIVLLVVSLFGLGYRAPWLFYFLVIDGALLLFNFPVGTIIGIALLIFCVMQKDEFLTDGKVPAGV